LLVAPAGGRATLRSATALPEVQRQALQAALKGALGSSALDFEVNPDLIAGIELSVNGQKLAWSISDYLAGLTKSLDGLVEALTNTVVTTEASHAASP
jgi:F-type H+-transporting ATPase subunit b